MKSKLLLVPVLVAAAGGVAAVALDSRSTHAVGDHRFAVPKKRLFDATIAWLLRPEADSFSFRLEMDRRSDHEHHVLVEPAKRICGSKPIAQIARIACGIESAHLRVGPPFRKVYPRADYAYAWDYLSVGKARPDGRAETLEVAYCSSIAPNPARPRGTAICTSLWGVSDLVLSLRFEEDELAQLPAMRAKATEMLRSWEIE